MGLIEEGQEVISESSDQEELAADLALIAAAQKVEHYEIAGYGTARCLARQTKELEVATLLTSVLGEEESADYLLTEISKPILQDATLMDNGGAIPENAGGIWLRTRPRREPRKLEVTMYHHIKQLMYTVQVGTARSDDSETCCWNNSAALTANWPRRCSIPFRV